ncbi:hypothetical protein D3C77_744380 [compost metagenome]
MVLARCEWGHDDYSLNVANLPLAEPVPVQHSSPARGRKGVLDTVTDDLFGSASMDEVP